MARYCGKCSLCCKLPYVAEISKSIDTWCAACKPGKGGCTIYDHRPRACANFRCAWLINEDENLGDEWFPARAKMILTYQSWGLLVSVDPAFPNAWRHEPYHSQLMAASAPMVQVRIGRRCIDLRTEQEVTRTQAWIEGREKD